MVTEDRSKQRLNYDLIAGRYDEPIRDHPADERLAEFMREAGLHASELMVLDMGCGTGKQQSANRAAYPSGMFVGLDLHEGMLRQAQARGMGVDWVQASSSAAPFRSAQFHTITNQFSYPHVQFKREMIEETFRLLRPGGLFVMTNIDPWAMRDWLIYRYFPAAWALDENDFLPPEAFTGLMRAAGFEAITIEHNDLHLEQTLREFYEYASPRHRASQFMAISDAAFRDGLATIERELVAAGDRSVQLINHISLITITGRKR